MFAGVHCSEKTRAIVLRRPGRARAESWIVLAVPSEMNRTDDSPDEEARGIGCVGFVMTLLEYDAAG